jgi:hypothetical protein
MYFFRREINLMKINYLTNISKSFRITVSLIKVIVIGFLLLGLQGCATRTLWNPIGTTLDYTINGELKSILIEHESEQSRSYYKAKLYLEYQLDSNQKKLLSVPIPSKGFIWGFDVQSNDYDKSNCSEKCRFEDFIDANFDCITKSITSKIVYYPWAGPYRLDMNFYLQMPKLLDDDIIFLKNESSINMSPNITKDFYSQYTPLFKGNDYIWTLIQKKVDEKYKGLIINAETTYPIGWIDKMGNLITSPFVKCRKTKHYNKNYTQYSAAGSNTAPEMILSPDNRDFQKLKQLAYKPNIEIEEPSYDGDCEKIERLGFMIGVDKNKYDISYIKLMFNVLDYRDKWKCKLNPQYKDCKYTDKMDLINPGMYWGECGPYGCKNNYNYIIYLDDVNNDSGPVRNSKTSEDDEFHYMYRFYSDFIYSNCKNKNYKKSEKVNILNSKVISFQEAQNRSIEILVMKKKYKFPLLVRIVSTPFTAMYDVVTLPIQVIPYILIHFVSI